MLSERDQGLQLHLVRLIASLWAEARARLEAGNVNGYSAIRLQIDDGMSQLAEVGTDAANPLS